MGNVMIQKFVEVLIVFGAKMLLPLMAAMWVGSMALRGLVYYTVKREDWFAREFEKRVIGFLEEDHRKENFSFFLMTKRLLAKTFYEMFEMRGIMKRRRLDYIADPMDRLFLIQHGCAFLVRDTLKQIKFLKFDRSQPRFLEISKTVHQNNACFNKVFGVIPLAAINDVLNIMPGLFVVGGIFGTFLGIMEALPRLGGMDMNDPTGAKLVLDQFLLSVAFAMSNSVCGILFSVTTQVWNTSLSADKLFVDVVDRYENILGNLWNRCDNNALPEELEAFDEHKDPIEALADLAVNKEIESGGPAYYRRVKSFLPKEEVPFKLPAARKEAELPLPTRSNDKKDAA